ncbi:MAG TPA: hypothetical protein VHM25_06080 [Polyangiaceae bacterium]|jgi:hypothetical protein|nr:hypothetical protein [Polyangiaceae bacterium]
MAGVLQGAPFHTIDLDIVCALSEPNIRQLELALTELGAVFREIDGAGSECFRFRD